MSHLNNEQLQMLTVLNQTRLALTNQFKNNVNPSREVIFRQLLNLEVFLMENKYKEQFGELLEENHENLIVLIDNMLVKDNSDVKTKKFNIKWTDNKPQPHTIVKEEREIRFEDPRFKRPNIVHQTQKEAPQRQERPDFNAIQKAKSVVPPGQFVSASILPKGTSIRKKFVPPFKKSEAPLKEMGDKNEEDQQKPVFKNLEQKLVNIITSQILQKGEPVKWSSIAGLGFAKRIIHEMIVWPMQRPDIFTGMRAPPRAILLFGPPGTGKTMIGRAIASEASATFFSISASSLTSKWVGQSQKLVKTLFTIARAKQPSVIFIDEIDSLLSARSQGEQQSSRRVKTQFLVQLDGAKTNNNERVLIIGATNLPKQLDDAVRRRFVKRLYIPLPNLDGRYQLIKTLTNNNAFSLSQEDMKQLAGKTKGFSGADLYTFCSQASMIPLREMSSIENIRHSEVPSSQIQHFDMAFKLVRPSVNKKMLKSFQQFNQQYGSYQFSPDELEDEEEKSDHADTQS